MVASGGGDAGAHTLSIGAACWRLTCVVFTYPFICVFAFNTAGGTQRAGRVGRREGVAERSGGGRRGQSRARSPEDRDVRGRRTRTDKAADEGTASAAGLKRTREEEQEAYRRCKTARQTDLSVMLAGPKEREVGESGELDTG